MMDFALLLLYHILNHAFACIHFHLSCDIDTRERKKIRRRTKFTTENEQYESELCLRQYILCNHMKRNILLLQIKCIESLVVY